MSKILSWGACQPYARKYGSDGAKGTEWVKFDVPAEDSTSLETTEGDKTEATVEGGDNEAVRRSKNKYALSFEERMGAGYKYKLDEADGIVDGEFEFLLVPTENENAPALYIPKASATVSDSYTSADGTKVKYTFDALKNDGAYGQVVWGTATITGGNPTKFEALKDTSESKTNLLA